MNGKKLLIVEDENFQSGILKDKFEKEGCEVLHARDGAEGLKMALEEHPDVLLLDIILPKLTGLELIEELRKDDWGKDAKVVILSNLTNFGDIEDHEKLLNDEVSHLIKADSSLDEIIETVTKAAN